VRLLPSLLLLSLFCVSLSAAELKKTVCPGGGCDYTGLEACLAANEQDLTDAGGDYFLAEIQDGTGWTGSPDTTVVDVGLGWTTAAGNYIKIYTTAAARHNGAWDTTAYILSITNDTCMYIREDYVYVEGLQFNTVSVSANAQNGVESRNTQNYVSYCIVKGSNSGTYTQSGLYMSGATVYFYNNVVWNINKTINSTGMYHAGTTGYFYNNTVDGGRIGVWGSSGTETLINNIVIVGSADLAFYLCTSGQNNYNSTNQATGSGGANDRVSQTFTFVDSANGDYHLQSGDGGAKDFGVSDPGSGLYSDDIDNVTRTGTWDIGADEYVSAAVGDTGETAEPWAVIESQMSIGGGVSIF
jgi:hypothetical protein